MKTFFTASKTWKGTHQKIYDSIVVTIKKFPSEVISLETQSYEDLISKKAMENLTESELHYLYIKKGIRKAQAVIIEASNDSFRLGHEATLAILYNKPVLCLSDSRDYSEKIVDPLFYSYQYKNENDASKKVDEFLQLVKNRYLTVRFNSYLSPHQKNFLEWYANKNYISSAEVIRDLVNKLIEDTPEFNDETNVLERWTGDKL